MRLIADILQEVERADRMMQRNHKLTKVIAGRTIKAVTVEPGSVLVLFDDQSNMKIKTTGAAAVSPRSRVKSVHKHARRRNYKATRGLELSCSALQFGPLCTTIFTAWLSCSTFSGFFRNVTGLT